MTELTTMLWPQLLSVGSVVLLYEGSRGLVQTNRYVRNGALLLIGLAICGWYAIWSHGMGETLSAPLTVEKSKIDWNLPEAWGNELSAIEREKRTLQIARSAFQAEGKLVKYFDQAGTWKVFCPNQSEIASLAEWEAGRGRMNQIIEGFRASASGSPVLGGTAIGIGIVVGFIKRLRSTAGAR